MAQHYDIIGDIHGHADELEALLIKLGYQLLDGIYQHEYKRVIYLGDFIDRGPQQRQVINIVRPMVERGDALSVMGNHEFNAICFATLGSDGQPLRNYSVKNIKQHQKFLDAYPSDNERNNVINWFKTLPVYLEIDGIRVIHAAWNEPAREAIASLLDYNHCLPDAAYETCSQKGSDAFEAIEILLKGPEAALPEGVTFKDKDGHVRGDARIQWWKDQDASIQSRLDLGSNITDEHKIEQTAIDPSHYYHPEHPPLFVGHYWLDDKTPTPLSDNCACLDFSIAKQGKLVAYRWEGEKTLKESNFIWCE
jgi:hypothetical protein